LAGPSSSSDNNPYGGSDKAGDGLTQKTNLYIKECVNRYSNSVMDSYRRYASWLKDIERGPTGKEGIVYGLYDINSDGQDCLDAIKKAKGINPGLPEAEASADKYAGALKEASNKSKPSILTITMKIIRTTGFSGARKRILLCWQPSEILSRRTRVSTLKSINWKIRSPKRTWKSLRTIRRKNMITP